MYLSRIRRRDDIQPRDLARYFDEHSNSSAYKKHRFVWTFFPETLQTRNFLFRHEFDPKSGKDSYLILSEEIPKPRNEKDQLLWNIETKDFAPFIRVGDRLEFRVRVNPTFSPKRTAAENGEVNKRGRADVLLYPRHAVPEDERAKWYQENLHAKGQEWLEKRAERCGFILVDDFSNELDEDDLASESFPSRKAFRVEAHNQPTPNRSPNASRESKITVSMMDLAGTLTVTDSVKFQEMLRTGLGHAKAFGCGLMLIRRAL